MEGGGGVTERLQISQSSDREIEAICLGRPWLDLSPGHISNGDRVVIQVMERNCRKKKLLGGNRPGWELLQLWSHYRLSLCGSPMYSIAVRPQSVL